MKTGYFLKIKTRLPDFLWSYWPFFCNLPHTLAFSINREEVYHTFLCYFKFFITFQPIFVCFWFFCDYFLLFWLFLLHCYIFFMTFWLRFTLYVFLLLYWFLPFLSSFYGLIFMCFFACSEYINFQLKNTHPKFCSQVMGFLRQRHFSQMSFFLNIRENSYQNRRVKEEEYHIIMILAHIFFLLIINGKLTLFIELFRGGGITKLMHYNTWKWFSYFIDLQLGHNLN